MYGKTIKSIRKSKGISQFDLAQNIMSRSNLSNFENDHYIPAFDKVIELLNRLNVTIDEFLALSEQADTYYQILYNELVASENYGSLDDLKAVNEKISSVRNLSSKHYELYLL